MRTITQIWDAAAKRELEYVQRVVSGSHVVVCFQSKKYRVFRKDGEYAVFVDMPYFAHYFDQKFKVPLNARIKKPHRMILRKAKVLLDMRDMREVMES